MRGASSSGKLTGAPDGSQPLAVGLQIDVITAAGLAALDEKTAAADREREVRGRRVTAFARKAGLLPRRRHPVTVARHARPRGAGRPRARRVSRSTTRSGDSGDSEPGEPPPALAGPSPRFSRPWRPITEALLDGAREQPEQLDLDGLQERS